nr:unnamed protein product [Spirometra erinaceieuropaei]
MPFSKSPPCQRTIRMRSGLIENLRTSRAKDPTTSTSPTLAPAANPVPVTADRTVTVPPPSPPTDTIRSTHLAHLARLPCLAQCPARRPACPSTATPEPPLSPKPTLTLLIYPTYTVHVHSSHPSAWGRHKSVLTDDLLVTSQNAEGHREHLTLVLDPLDKYCVIISPSKCVFGWRPLLSKVKDIRDFFLQTSKCQFQRSFDLGNCHRRFPLNCADFIPRLAIVLSGPKGPIELIGEVLITFERIKASLADISLLTHPASVAPPPLMIEVSTAAVGSVHQQRLADAAAAAAAASSSPPLLLLFLNSSHRSTHSFLSSFPSRLYHKQ